MERFQRSNRKWHHLLKDFEETLREIIVDPSESDSRIFILERYLLLFPSSSSSSSRDYREILLQRDTGEGGSENRVSDENFRFRETAV